jgi:hypothetical protein
MYTLQIQQKDHRSRIRVPLPSVFSLSQLLGFHNFHSNGVELPGDGCLNSNSRRLVACQLSPAIADSSFVLEETEKDSVTESRFPDAFK